MIRLTRPLQAASPATAPTNVRRVLFVDDLPQILDLLTGIARQSRGVQLRVRTEMNSQRAVELVKAERFDVVVSDFRMREADGLEVLLQARAAHPEGRRVLMTGYNEIPATPERVAAAAPDALLQKPLDARAVGQLLSGLALDDAASLSASRERARALLEARSVS